MIACPFYSREPGNKHNGLCALGLYGGKPFAGNCGQCIAKGQNNPEYAAELFARSKKSFPESARKNIRPCC